MSCSLLLYGWGEQLMLAAQRREGRRHLDKEAEGENAPQAQHHFLSRHQAVVLHWLAAGLPSPNVGLHTSNAHPSAPHLHYRLCAATKYSISLQVSFCSAVSRHQLRHDGGLACVNAHSSAPHLDKRLCAATTYSISLQVSFCSAVSRHQLRHDGGLACVDAHSSAPSR